MFEHLYKFKKKKPPIPGAVICPACDYERQATDTTPEWQCPGCGVAYHKVTEEYKTEAMRKDREEYSKEQARQKHNKKLTDRSILLMTAGYIAGALGFSTTCVADPSFLVRNPFAGVVGVGAIIYGFYYLYKNWKKKDEP